MSSALLHSPKCLCSSCVYLLYVVDSRHKIIFACYSIHIGVDNNTKMSKTCETYIFAVPVHCHLLISKWKITNKKMQHTFRGYTRTLNLFSHSRLAISCFLRLLLRLLLYLLVVGIERKGSCVVAQKTMNF